MSEVAKVLLALIQSAPEIAAVVRGFAAQQGIDLTPPREDEEAAINERVDRLLGERYPPEPDE